MSFKILTGALLAAALCALAQPAPRIAVIVSANAEWRVVRELYPQAAFAKSPYGEFFEQDIAGERVVIFHGGWGKVDAAASAQYLMDRWHPRVVMNLGTCGGIAGRIARFDTVLADRTVIYDIVEMMGDSSEAIRDYSTAIDLDWLGGKFPSVVRRAPLVSADRDLAPADIPKLQKLYGAVAADWESGAIARVAVKNGARVVILRGVSDLVTSKSGQAYGKPEVFVEGTGKVMRALFRDLAGWVELVRARM